MAGGKETPRQKMIGMMYLVLTAMLALNVSKEIINAFVTQDNQMLVNNNNLVEGVNGFMAKFSMMAVDPTTKNQYEKWKPKTQKVNQLANQLDDYLLENLNKMMEQSEQKKDWFVKTKESQYTTWEPIESIKNKEDYDVATRLFGGEKGSKGYKNGGEIRTMLMELRDSLVYTMGNYSERGKSIELDKSWLKNSELLESKLEENQHPDKLKLLSIYTMLTQPEKLKNHEKDQEWQLVKFDHQPIVGAIGVFTEMRNQVRMAQQKSLELVSSKINGQIMRINKIEPQLIANTRYLNQGDTLGVRVGIIAYDSTATYPIKYRIGTKELSSDNNRFTIRASSVGKQSVEGSLMLDLADGKREFPWSFDYTVGKPVGTISSPELNVLYAGHNNQIEGTISGYSPNQVKLTCDGCSSVEKQGDKYIVRTGSSKEATLKVSAPGTVIVRKYKVLPLPKPELTFIGKSYGSLRRGVAIQGKTVKVSNPPSSPLRIGYEVVSFKFGVVLQGKLLEISNQGNRLNNKSINLLKQVKRGSKIFITEVVYKRSGSSKKKSIPGLNLRVT